MSFIDDDLQSIQEARILVERARDAHETLIEYRQEDLDQVLTHLIGEIKKQQDCWIEQSINESGYGLLHDQSKIVSNLLKDFEEKVLPQQIIGALNKEAESIVEVGVPLGVIPVLLPVENDVVNMIYALLIGIKSGNCLLFIPHKESGQSLNLVARELIELLENLGLPSGTMTILNHVSEVGITEICQHPDVALILDIGCLDYLKATPLTNKPLIYGGTGSIPVFIERSADIRQACQMIVESRSFNNGLMPASEQYIVTEGIIAEKVKATFKENGAYFLTSEEEKQLQATLTLSPQSVCGKTAYQVAKTAGFNVSEDTKVLVSEQQYIYDESLYAKEWKFPLLVFYLEPNWIRACEKSIELLRNEKNGHTIMVHSVNSEILNEFALKKPVGRMVVNGSSLNSMGFCSDLSTSLILGGLSVGKGITADNVTAKHLTYQRKISYVKEQCFTQDTSIVSDDVMKEKLTKILKQILDKSEGV